tara:strand:+ start:397 stop:537 length:141 start_codon:yes stop_codon:yes gene_type:complete
LEVGQLHSSEEACEQNLKKKDGGVGGAKEADRKKISQQEYDNDTEH